MTEYVSIHLENQRAEYGRIPDVSDAALSIRSLYKLLSSYYISMLRQRYLNIQSKTQVKEAPQRHRPHSNFFSQMFLKLLLNGKFNSKINTIRAFYSKIWTLFLISKTAREASPLPPSCAPVGVTEYAPISLNMPKYL